MRTALRLRFFQDDSKDTCVITLKEGAKIVNGISRAAEVKNNKKKGGREKRGITWKRTEKEGLSLWQFFLKKKRGGCVCENLTVIKTEDDIDPATARKIVEQPSLILTDQK